MKTYAQKKWGNCSKAVAYQLNFVQMCYTSGNCSKDQFFESLCPHYEDLSLQYSDLVYPKSSFSKKDYYILDYYYYGVSEQLKNDMIEFGVSKDNFRPIYTKNQRETIGYQIIAKHKLPPMYKSNSMHEVILCDKCNLKIYEYDEANDNQAYNGLGYPIYITKEVYDDLQDINCSYEDKRDVIISLNLYNYLIEKYPRLECRPVFIGNVKDDPEYKKLNTGDGSVS